MSEKETAAAESMACVLENGVDAAALSEYADGSRTLDLESTKEETAKELWTPDSVPDGATGKKEPDKDKTEGTDDAAAHAAFRRQTALVSTAVLAYIGDAVYETYVRRHVFHQGLLRPNRLHQASVTYVRAEAQAAVFDAVWDELTPEEQAVARRGKNHKITSMPHNVDAATYKKATGFEALIGFLNLSGESEREHYLMQRAFHIIEKAGVTPMRRDHDTKQSGR